MLQANHSEWPLLYRSSAYIFAFIPPKCRYSNLDMIIYDNLWNYNDPFEWGNPWISPKEFLAGKALDNPRLNAIIDLGVVPKCSSQRNTEGVSPFQRSEAWSEIDPWKVEAVWRILMWTKKTCGSKHPAKMFLLDQQRYTEEQSHTPLFTPFTGNGTYKSTKWNVLSRTWWSKMDGSWIESSTSCWCYLARILMVIPEEDASIK